MATAIIKPETQEQFISKNKALKAWADDLVVRDAGDAMQAKQAQLEVRNEMKMRGFVLDPFVLTARAALQATKDERDKWITPLEDIDQALAVKVKEYERKEREAAAREQERINAERRVLAEAEAKLKREAAEIAAAALRKAREKEIAEAQKAGDLKKREADKMRKEAEAAAALAKQEAAKQELLDRQVEDVIVKPNIPTVAGVPSRTNYKFRVIDATKVPRQYLCPDEVKIGRDVRDWKKTGEVIPGIECYVD